MTVILTIANESGWPDLFTRVRAVIGWPDYWSEVGRQGWSKPPLGYGLHWRVADEPTAHNIKVKVLAVAGVNPADVEVRDDE
jgi:hypothetical protein